jgi:vancomycin resistance protein YoaR
MGKRNLVTAESEPVELDYEFADESDYDTASAWQRAPLWLRILSAFVVAGILLVASFEIVYAGRIFPGVTADGVSLSGLSRAQAAKQLEDKTKLFSGQVVTISNGDTNLRIPVASLGVSYDTDKVVDQAFLYGRTGGWVARGHQQLRALFARITNFSSYKYDENRLVPYIVDMSEELLTPVADASLSFDEGKPQVTPAQSGTRLDYGRLTQLVADRLSQTSADTIKAPVYQLAPVLTTDSLKAVTTQLGSYVAGPIQLTSTSNDDITIDEKTIISWIEVGARTTKPFLSSHDVADLYPPPPSANIGLNKAVVAKYVTGLAADLDQTPQNAGLAMQDGKLAIVQPSRTGVKLDQAAATAGILASLKKSAGDRDVQLKLSTATADVNETNLDSLGIVEQISEGETYFPGSPSTRLTNVRAGAKRFNGVLLKPGETFSFGALLGDVGPETGYVPELVILGDHEEKQYGGGLCQVSSTAFRAALNAGLPITERTTTPSPSATTPGRTPRPASTPPFTTPQSTSNSSTTPATTSSCRPS